MGIGEVEKGLTSLLDWSASTRFDENWTGLSLFGLLVPGIQSMVGWLLPRRAYLEKMCLEPAEVSGFELPAPIVYGGVPGDCRRCNSVESRELRVDRLESDIKSSLVGSGAEESRVTWG